MNRPWSPTRVTMPPPSVPGFIVTYSRIVLWRPMLNEESSPRYLRSCGSKPIEANGKMRVPSPIIVRPSTTTCDISRTPAPSSTCPPRTQYGPMTTSSAKFAPGATIAVAWICGIGGLLVEDHRGKHRFSHQLAADLAAPLEFPHIAAVALLGDMDVKTIARKHRAAEAGVVDAHEIDE